MSGGDPEVAYLDREPNGLAAMLGGLIQSNLATHRDRIRYLGRIATFSIFAPDAEVGASIRLSPDRVAVRNGVVKRAHVHIEADSGMLLGLTAVPLRFGLPDPTRKEGRAVLRDVIRRRIRIRGLLAHPGKLARLDRLLSVS
jgi:hypothetical protein